MWIEVLKGILIVVGILWLSGIAVSSFLMATAKEGREDDDGFHHV